MPLLHRGGGNAARPPGGLCMGSSTSVWHLYHPLIPSQETHTSHYSSVERLFLKDTDIQHKLLTGTHRLPQLPTPPLPDLLMHRQHFKTSAEIS